jgi:hypothetical protein
LTDGVRALADIVHAWSRRQQGAARDG